MDIKNVYFAQHGIALSKNEDPDRPLSDTGITQTKSVAEYFTQNNLTIHQIFHSGKLRAQQTAEIFASALNTDTPLPIKNFSPNDNVKLAAAELNIESALYVGHLPQLEKLVSYLLCQDESSKIIQFQNSAIVCLEKNNGQFLLTAYIPPER